MAGGVNVVVHQAAMDAVLAKAAETTLRRRGNRVEARAKRLVRVDEGRLRNSIHSTFVPSPTRPRVRVGSDVSYARAVHDGTGIYGPRHQPIRPVRAKVLRWTARGMTSATSRSLTATGVVYARQSKGSPPNPYLRDALPEAR